MITCVCDGLLSGPIVEAGGAWHVVLLGGGTDKEIVRSRLLRAVAAESKGAGTAAHTPQPPPPHLPELVDLSEHAIALGPG